MSKKRTAPSSQELRNARREQLVKVWQEIQAEAAKRLSQSDGLPDEIRHDLEQLRASPMPRPSQLKKLPAHEWTIAEARMSEGRAWEQLFDLLIERKTLAPAARAFQNHREKTIRQQRLAFDSANGKRNDEICLCASNLLAGGAKRRGLAKLVKGECTAAAELSVRQIQNILKEENRK